MLTTTLREIMALDPCPTTVMFLANVTGKAAGTVDDDPIRGDLLLAGLGVRDVLSGLVRNPTTRDKAVFLALAWLAAMDLEMNVLSHTARAALYTALRRLGQSPNERKVVVEKLMAQPAWSFERRTQEAVANITKIADDSAPPNRRGDAAAWVIGQIPVSWGYRAFRRQRNLLETQVLHLLAGTYVSPIDPSVYEKAPA